MKKATLIACAILFLSLHLFAQKIIPIDYNGKKYEVLDMTYKGKVSWGGYEEIALDAAKSNDNGAANTIAIVAAVGKNENYDGKPYAAKLCSEAAVNGKDDWYLPSKDETDAIYAFKDKFAVEERGTIWSSTEASGTQAVTKYWGTGAFYNVQKVDEYQFVCIRKVQ
jgi:hypothetical protein